MFGIQVSLYFHQFIVNNYNFSKHCYYYYILLQRITCYNHCFSRSFCLLSVFLIRCLIDRCFCWRHLTLNVLLFRLTASSCPGFPYSPFLSNALSSRAIAEPSPASWFRRLASSRPNFFYIQKDPLDGAASFFRWPCYRSKICSGDEPGEQLASTEDPRKRKIKKQFSLKKPLQSNHLSTTATFMRPPQGRSL